MLPLTAKFTGRSSFAVLQEYIQPVLGPIAASLAVLALLVIFCGPPAGFVGCAWRGSLVFGAAIWFGIPHFRNLLAKPSPAAPPPAVPAPAIS
jgi:type IV secretory pathway VirB2 component (pilin)